MCKMGLLHSVQACGRLAVLNRNGRTAQKNWKKNAYHGQQDTPPPPCVAVVGQERMRWGLKIKYRLTAPLLISAGEHSIWGMPWAADHIPPTAIQPPRGGGLACLQLRMLFVDLGWQPSVWLYLNLSCAELGRKQPCGIGCSREVGICETAGWRERIWS